MKKIYSIFFLIGVVCMILLSSGCATVDEPLPPAPIDYEMRLKHAKKQRETLTRLLEHAQSVDDAVNARDQLAKVQKEIENLEAGKLNKKLMADGFKSTKKRTVVYGPIGWVLVGSKWIVDKLYIMYPWNWRAF
jgi:hypothetical protein